MKNEITVIEIKEQPLNEDLKRKIYGRLAKAMTDTMKNLIEELL